MNRDNLQPETRSPTFRCSVGEKMPDLHSG